MLKTWTQIGSCILLLATAVGAEPPTATVADTAASSRRSSSGQETKGEETKGEETKGEETKGKVDQEAQQHAAPQPTVPQIDRQLLSDLARIRQKMGGSVLGGSLLETVDAERTFQSKLETLLVQPDESPASGSSVRVLQPPTMIQNETGDLFEPIGDPEPFNPSTEPASLQTVPASQAVMTLRQQSENLEDVANRLERIQQYDHADDLRASARILRELARTLDAPPSGTPLPTIPTQGVR